MEKCMPLSIRMTIAAFLLIPQICRATSVSSECLTISGIENNIASGNDHIVYFASQGISGCGTEGTSFSIFMIGIDGVTNTNINSILAIALSAYATGHQVSVQYDNSSVSCFGEVIDVGATLVATNCS
jgi:hypothetical protein